LIINNFVSPHSAGANCESDESIGSLDNLRNFIEQPNLERVTPDVAKLNFSNFEVVPNVVANIGLCSWLCCEKSVGKE
jgi:hypothetical protein